ncbi:class I SAM-dependent methyltransferase [Mycolicibacterium madagascariense]|uniref:class I SAM-dependent methyltransferase n=1 Tax=Mycolicibacterium madagascariense TaxID=212765 RepID=UPI0013D6A168|nr:class I SAM-dependent methyltransferase [Mycolicibacterium madagascariense]MCV7014603.1 SAM-dependent methyltransferase [Mycolicibacterium madagascariense]
MPESSVVVRPQPRDGGPHSTASRLQAAGLRRATSLFEQAAAVVPLPRSPRPIVIADYGAATGHNSLLPIGAAVAAVRTRTRPEHSILVTHTDVPDNDFTALFRTLADDPDSYLKSDAACFASAVGRSYYTQIVPSNSVNLAWSAWSVQWLAHTPAPVPDHVVVALSRDDAVRAAYQKQAARDWHEFVAFRGRELSPGGRLVVMTMALGEDGDFGYGPLLDAVTETLSELVARDVLTEDEARVLTIPVVGRKARDFLSPFAPSGTFEKLTVEHLEVFDAEDRFWAQYRLDHEADAFGARWADFLVASAFPTLAATLPAERRAGLLDALREGVAQRLSAAPAEMRIPMALAVIEKKQRAQGAIS